MSDSVRKSFDTIAEQYLVKFADELGRKPADQELLSAFATRVGDGRVLDIGCGPGQVGDFVAALGPGVTGVDFSLDMLRHGKKAFPRLGFVCADMRRLPFADASVDGIVAFYSLIFGPLDDAAAGLREFRRVSKRGAPMIVAVHGGEGSDHFQDFDGTAIDVTIHWRDPDLLAKAAEEAGYTVERVTVREPYPDEHPTRRVYIQATA